MPNHDRLSVLSVAMTAALKAGDYFESRLHTEKAVKTKSSMSDLVTDVDPACEKLIRETILGIFPDHQILGEESVAPGAEASVAAVDVVADAAHLWIVDPLDGTTNFVYSVPLSTVSIGYAENGRLIAGVIYDPYRAEMFFALLGHGAYRTNAETAAMWAAQPADDLPGFSMKASDTQEIEQAVVASGFPTRGEMRMKTTEAGLLITNRVKNFRALGSAALHLAYVAAGRLDAFWEYDLNAWDLAAGMLLVTEAGGSIQSISGASYTLRTRDVVAAGRERLAHALAGAVYIE